MTTGFDPRRMPARNDIAASHLKGKVDAAAFVEGRSLQVARGSIGLFARPEEPAGQQTQLLFGETFRTYEEKNGWAWGQSDLDGYVGYARIAGFALPEAVTHRVMTIATPLFVEPDVKRGILDLLPMNAKVRVADGSRPFARLTGGYFAFARHLAPIESAVSDWVSAAEQFIGVPYVWGGKTSAGIDCSGLVQIALEAGGITSPRDTDMMEAELGHAIGIGEQLIRGDLIFWKGHVGIMLDSERLIHANGFAMQVSVEPLKLVDERSQKLESLPIRSIKRIG